MDGMLIWFRPKFGLGGNNSLVATAYISEDLA